MFVRWRERLVAGSLEHTYWPSSPGVFVGLLVKNTTISTEGGGAKVFSKWKRDGTAAIYTSFLHFVDCRLFSLICKERGVCWWVGCKSVCLFGGHLPKIKEIVHIEFNPDCNLLWIFSSVAFWEIWPLPNDVWWISFIKKPEDTPAKCARCTKHLLIPTAQWDGKWPWKWLSSENQTDPNNLIYIYIYICLYIYKDPSWCQKYPKQCNFSFLLAAPFFAMLWSAVYCDSASQNQVLAQHSVGHKTTTRFFSVSFPILGLFPRNHDDEKKGIIIIVIL